jgi:hypothetical protein
MLTTILSEMVSRDLVPMAGSIAGVGVIGKPLGALDWVGTCRAERRPIRAAFLNDFLTRALL